MRVVQALRRAIDDLPQSIEEIEKTGYAVRTGVQAAERAIVAAVLWSAVAIIISVTAVAAVLRATR